MFLGNASLIDHDIIITNCHLLRELSEQQLKELYFSDYENKWHKLMNLDAETKKNLDDFKKENS